MIHWSNGWGMMGGGWLVWLLLLIAVGVVIWILMRSARSSGSVGHSDLPRSDLPHSDRETPLEILQNRYARGEISKQQLEQMRADLKS